MKYTLQIKPDLLFEDVEDRLRGLSYKDVGYADADFIYIAILRDNIRIAEVFYSVSTECWVFDSKLDSVLCNYVGQAVQTGFVNLSSEQAMNKNYTVDTLFSRVEDSLVDFMNKKDNNVPKAKLDKTFAAAKDVKKSIEEVLYSFSTINNPNINEGKLTTHELVAVISLEKGTIRYSVRKNKTEVRNFSHLEDGIFHYNLLY